MYINESLEWSIQPHVPVEVNWDNPISRGLVFLYSAHDQHDLITNTPGVRFGSAAISPTQIGKGLESTSTSADGIYFALPADSPVYRLFANFSFVQFARIDAHVAFSSLFCIPYANGTWVSPFGSLGFQRNNTSGARVWGQSNVGAFALTTTTSYTVGAPSPGFYAFSHPSGGTALFNIEGAWSTTTALANTRLITWNTQEPLTLLNRSSSATGEGIDGISPFFAMWNRAISAQEILALKRNPWQLFAPIPLNFWSPQTAAGSIIGPLIGGSHLLTNGPLINGRLVA